MVDIWTAAAGVYGLGFVLALFLTDAQPVGRLGLALVWPLGPIAAVVTILVLLATATVTFPLFGAVVLGILVAWWSLG